MHTIDIPDINKKISFPGCVEEMTPVQYLAFISLFLKWKSGKINFIDFRVLMLMMLTGIKITKRYLRMSFNEKQPVNANIYLLTQLIDSFFTSEPVEGNHIKVLRFDFIKNPVPVYRNLYGPDDAIKDLTFHEYMDACNHLSGYMASENERSLNQLIAVLYRPRRFFHPLLKLLPGYNGQIRRRYNQYHTDRFARRIGKLPIEFRYGVMLWFRSCDQYLRTAKLTIGDVEVDFSLLYKSGDSTKPGIGMVGILYSLAESGIFGDVDKTAKQNLYDVMVRLYQLMLDYNDMKEKMNKKP